MAGTEEGRLIAEVTERVLADLSREVWDRVELGEWPAEAWATVADAGLPLALAPESAGGYGLSVVDALAVIRLCGQFATPLPLAESIIANGLLGRAGLEPDSGPMTLAVTNTPLSLRPDGWSLSCTVKRVPWARYCGLALMAPSSQGMKVVRLSRQDLTVTPGSNLAGEPRDEIRIDTDLPNACVGNIDLTPDQFRAMGAVMRTLQLAGALDEVARMTVAHAIERTQFGRPLGAFQAVQHQVAVLASHAAAARVASDLGVDAFAGDLEPRAVAAAKSRAGEAAGLAAAIAHQVHGAMGFTLEFRLQLLTRRLWSWRDEFGAEAEWNRNLGRALAARGADRLWAELTEI